MRKVLTILILIISFKGMGQTNGLVGVSLTGNGGIFEVGIKVDNVKGAVDLNLSGTNIHKHILILVGYSIKLSEYNDGDWIHQLLITPSIGFSGGTRKTDIINGNGKIYDKKENNLLTQIELSYRVSGLEIFINGTNTSKSYIGLGFRGYF